MEITINLAIEEAIKKAVNADVLGPVVEKAVFGAVKSAIEDATGYSSEFRKTMAAQLKEALPHGLGVDETAKFQFILNNAMQALVRETNTDTVTVAMREAVKAVLPEVNKVIKVTELLEMARDGFHVEKHEPFYAYFEESEYGGGTIFLDSEEHPGGSYRSHQDRESVRYAARYRLAFSKDGEVYSMRMDGTDLTMTKIPHAISHFDSTLLALYVGKSVIELDCNQDDVEYAAQAQYD